MHLLSTASLNIFPDYTLSSFKNQLPQNISLEGDWRVALSEIVFPSRIQNVTTEFLYHVTRTGTEEENLERNSPSEKPEKKETESHDSSDNNHNDKEKSVRVFNSYTKYKLNPGEYENLGDLVNHLRKAANSLNISSTQTIDLETAG